MTTRSARTSEHSDPRKPLSRADRRTAQRKRAREQRRHPTKWHFPTHQIVGVLATLTLVVGIGIYALLRTNSVSHSTGTQTGQALAVASDLHPASSMLQTGQTAPSFVLRDINGKVHGLAAQLGHPVVLEFFAVWCPHCQREAPLIDQLAKQYGSRGVQTWAILASPYGPNYDNSFGTDTTPAVGSDLRWFATTFHEHVPQLVDPTFHVVNEYGISSYPGIYVIGKDGRILYSTSGEQPYTALSNAVARALAQK